MTKPSSSSHRTAPGAVHRDLTVTNRFGIHARPAALIVKTASGFQSEVLIERDGVQVSAKSIMGLLTMEGHPGSVFRVLATGSDAAEAVEAIADLFEKKFFEE
ncbi:MAG: HPr family phosphocarrier protein [Kiritimatiellia bacterium]|nr:HPr family phosphocarrier protein [Kiritimatiellia bacterium]